MDREDCLKIHRAFCEILRQTGVKVYREAARTLLQSAGAIVTDELVKIPPSLVEAALASAPHRFNLYKRGSDEVRPYIVGSQLTV